LDTLQNGDLSGHVSKILTILQKMMGRKIVVIGDLVADIYVFGHVGRVSREAPVLILEHKEDRTILGGGANAVHNISSLGGVPMAIGVIGKDLSGAMLINEMQNVGISTNWIVQDAARPTTAKQRIMGSRLHTTFQQMLRIDKGIRKPLDPKVEAEVIGRLESALNQAEALVVSDYGYGVMTSDIIEKINSIAKQGNVPVFVDSRYSLKTYRHASALTPNEPEAEEALGMRLEEKDEEAIIAAEKLRNITSSKSVLLTRGRKGMVLAEENAITSISIFGTDEIADVTGAGDTVMAAFSLAVSSGADMPTAARLANVAGGLVVMKAGTAVVKSEEIRSALEDFSVGCNY